jgi:hypothetical protein
MGQGHPGHPILAGSPRDFLALPPPIRSHGRVEGRASDPTRPSAQKRHDAQESKDRRRVLPSADIEKEKQGRQHHDAPHAGRNENETRESHAGPVSFWCSMNEYFAA